MISHLDIKGKLLWPEELGREEREQLQRHLDDCEDCRDAVRVYVQNRLHLQVLSRLQPPAELHGRILRASVDTPAMLWHIWPLVVMTAAMPISLVGAALLLLGHHGGFAALFGPPVLVAALMAVRENLAFRRTNPGMGDPDPFWQRSLLFLGVELGGVVVGAALFGAALLGLSLLSSHGFH